MPPKKSTTRAVWTPFQAPLITWLPVRSRLCFDSPTAPHYASATTRYENWREQGIPEPHYPVHDRTVIVTSCGCLCLYRKKINLSKSLAGQAVGVKELECGIWLVSFMGYDLGYIDLEEKTLQPLANPFGPRVLPMS